MTIQVTEQQKQSKICELQNLLMQRDYTARKVVFEVAETLKKLYFGLELPLYEKYKDDEQKANGWRKIIDVCGSGCEIDANIYDEFLKNPDKYIIVDNVLILNPDYEQEQQQQEQKRIDGLNLTGTDVERAMLKAKGMDFDDVVNLVKEKMPGVDLKALKTELSANRFYRGNATVAQIAGLLKLTDEQLTRFFETNDYNILK